MKSRNVFASILMAGLLTAGFAGLAPVGNTALAGQLYLDEGKSTKDDVIENERRDHSQRIYLPVGPGSIYYDYPLYESRGYYPTHIGGYVYYGYPYGDSRD